MIAEFLGLNRPTAPRFGNATLENPAVSLHDPHAIEALGGTVSSAAGVRVNHQNAPSLSAVRQALRLISCDVSKLKLYPYKQLAEDEREVFKEHRSYIATAIRANPLKSARQFWQDIMVHALLYENGYAYITKDRRTGRTELYNILPDRTAPEWHNGELIYVTEVAGRLETLWPNQVLHIRGLSLDGTVGSDFVRDARDTLGLAMARRNFESKFFKNGARRGGTLTVPRDMTQKAKETLEEGFRKAYEEGDNPFKTIVAREGSDFKVNQSSPEEAQIGELREEDRREIASFFELPPSKLGIRDSMSYNSFEQDNLNYLHGCLHHWADTVSDECDMKLLDEDELLSGEVDFEHDYSEFIQADYKTMAETLVALRNAEFINADEGRHTLGYNPRKDGGGKTYQNPNTKSAGAQAAGEPPPPAKKKAATNARQRLIEDVVGRMNRRVGAQARKLADNPGEFLKWIDAGADEQRQAFDEAMLPVLQSVFEAVDAGDGGLLLASQAAFRDGFLAQIDGLRKLTEPPHIGADLKENVTRFLTNFERTTPERVAANIMEMINGAA